jgi:hypothetical protein
MTKAEIALQYEVDEFGRIKSPGKFENEMYYAVHYWNCVLDGFADEDYEENGTMYAIINLTPDDFKNYPELNNLDGVEFLKLWENDNGFVYCEHI